MSEFSGMNDAFEMTNEDAVLHENEERTYRGKKVREHVDELVENSTLHGLHYCFDRQFLIKRICWSILILVALALVIQQLYLGGNHYFKYPFFTVITTKHVSKLVFPAVSICNLNTLRFSAINGTWLHDYYMGAQPDNASTFDNEFTKTTLGANHQIKTMLKSCSMTNLPCSFKNFTRYQETGCYTFNSGSPGHPLITVDSTNGLKGLELVIDVEHDDYFKFTDEYGICMKVHGQNNFIFDSWWIFLLPGFSTTISLKKRKVKNLPSPYATNCGKINLKNIKVYSKIHCFYDRYIDAVATKCGCKAEYMAGKHRVCSSKKELFCIWNVWENFRNEKDPCPLPCIEESYIPTISMSRYPSNHVADQFAKSLNLTGTKTSNRKWIRDHYLKLTVSFDEFSYEDVEQVPAYNIMMLLGDVGGILGLFLGASILTFIEFFDCIAMLLFSRFKLFKKCNHF